MEILHEWCIIYGAISMSLQESLMPPLKIAVTENDNIFVFDGFLIWNDKKFKTTLMPHENQPSNYHS